MPTLSTAYEVCLKVTEMVTYHKVEIIKQITFSVGGLVVNSLPEIFSPQIVFWRTHSINIHYSGAK